jgi:hypothetical protein
MSGWRPCRHPCSAGAWGALGTLRHLIHATDAWAGLSRADPVAANNPEKPENPSWVPA